MRNKFGRMTATATKAILLCSALAGACAAASADEFVMPAAGEVFIKGTGGSGGARSNFGLGTTVADFTPYLFSLPANTAEIDLGHFAAGQVVPFAMVSTFGTTEYAFSTDSVTPASRTAFMDLDNSLKLGGSVIQPLGDNTYRLNLDDANSHNYDDNDHDLLVDVRLVPDAVTATPLPTGLAGGAVAVGTLLAAAAITSKRKARTA